MSTISGELQKLKKINHIPLACSIVFANYKLFNLQSADKNIIDRALEMILKLQNSDGSWNCWELYKMPDIETTAMAIHALAVVKPLGWERSVKLAKNWLLNKRTDYGSWISDSSPDDVFLTVLVLDAIDLADNKTELTFSLINESVKNEVKNKKSSLDVTDSRMVYINQLESLVNMLSQKSAFYSVPGNTIEEALKRIEFLKDVIENKGGHKLFYHKGKPITKEEDIHILYRLTWFASPSNVSREVNDGRGPIDFKISRGSKDKTLVEFKLASNSHLSRNLQRQLEIYKKASDAERGYKVIFYFSKRELSKVKRILKALNINEDPHVILVDARKDNKPSGSKA